MKPYYNYLVTEDGKVYNKFGKQIKQQINSRGYPFVCLRVDNKPHTKTVHRIVAETYITNHNNLSDVDHIDGNRLNNTVNNLRWTTHGDNIRHCYALNNRSAKGENNARALISKDTAKQICELLEAGYSAAQIRDLGFPYNIVRTIKQRKNWKEVSDFYKF